MSTTTSTSEKPSKKKKEIVIPKYIPRGPTDILDALAQTVGKVSESHVEYEILIVAVSRKSNTSRLLLKGTDLT